MDNGVKKSSRAGNTISVFGRMLKWDLSEGFPAMTTRKVAFRIAFEETMFFLRGNTDTTLLEEKNINIWRGNTSREFLDDKGLTELPVGSLGTGYSHQWRNYGGKLDGTGGVDQIAQLIEGLRADPDSRRHIVSAWNPTQLDGTPLPPCHIKHQYYIADGKLSSSFEMRSTDVVFGLPYNIMSYAFINAGLCEILNLEQGELTYFGNDVHIYDEQIPMTIEQLDRDPRPLPKIVFKKEINTLDDLLSLEFSDVELVGYDPHPDIKNKPPMAV